MKKILLLNGGKQFAHSDGRYNATLHEAAVDVMKMPNIENDVKSYEAHLAQVFGVQSQV